VLFEENSKTVFPAMENILISGKKLSRLPDWNVLSQQADYD